MLQAGGFENFWGFSIVPVYFVRIPHTIR